MSNKRSGKLAPIDARHRVQPTWGALTGPKLGSTQYKDVEFAKHMTKKTNEYQKMRARASLNTDYETIEKSRRLSDPMELRRRERLFVDKSRDTKMIRERFQKLYKSEHVRRAVQNANQRRSDVAPVVNKGYLLGGFVFKSAMKSEAKRQFHSTGAAIVAEDPDDLQNPREHRKDDMAHAYVNENHSQFKFPLRDYDRRAGKPWIASNGLNSKNWKDRSRR